MTGLGLAILAWRNLWRNRRRTVLTLAAIAFGVFLAVLFTAMQDRSFADMIDLSARLGGGHVVVQHHEYLETPTLSRTVVVDDALRARVEAVDGVTRAVSRISGPAMLATASHSSGVFFMAYDPGLETVDTLPYLDGRVTGALPSNDNDRGVTLGRRLAENLQVELGDKVVYTMMDRNGEIAGGMGRVIGTLETGAPSLDGSLVLLPIDRMRGVIAYGPTEATTLAVFIDDARGAGPVAAGVAPLLGDDAVALTWDEVQPELSGFIAMKVGGARFMELIIMVLVAASIFNTLFVSVMERTREFGILMAIGYRPGQIFALVMWESLWLALLGLAGGALVTIGPYSYLAANGVDISAQLGDEAIEVAGVGMSPILNVGIFPENVVLIAAFAVGATLLSGLYPAWRAGRTVPVETIKLV